MPQLFKNLIEGWPSVIDVSKADSTGFRPKSVRAALEPYCEAMEVGDAWLIKSLINRDRSNVSRKSLSVYLVRMSETKGEFSIHTCTTGGWYVMRGQGFVTSQEEHQNRVEAARRLRNA